VESGPAGRRVRNWKPVIAWVQGLSNEERTMIWESEFHQTLAQTDKDKLERLAEQVSREKVYKEFEEYGGAPPTSRSSSRRRRTTRPNPTSRRRSKTRTTPRDSLSSSADSTWTRTVLGLRQHRRGA
jgi:hypothetical protein